LIGDHDEGEARGFQFEQCGHDSGISELSPDCLFVRPEFFVQVPSRSRNKMRRPFTPAHRADTGSSGIHRSLVPVHADPHS